MTQPLPSSAPQRWHLDPPYGARSVLIALAALLVLTYTGRHVEIGRMLALTGEGALHAVGAREDSQVGQALSRIAASLFPLQISERREVARLENFDRHALPWLSHLEQEDIPERKLDPDTLQLTTVHTSREVLVEPLGYLWHVLAKMLETLEIALWGTVLAVIMSGPLAWLGARNYSPNHFMYSSARALTSLLRALPELISALFLVLAYGFGPIAGVLALALHGAGFLGKFYAEDIENADDRPQEALRAIGANKAKTLAFAVFPQVLPQYIAYTLYVLDRNIRMATVVGLVGAGGIGQELKGRYDMYNYGHVGTILLVIFLTVFVLDRISARLRLRVL